MRIQRIAIRIAPGWYLAILPMRAYSRTGRLIARTYWAGITSTHGTRGWGRTL